MVGLLPSDLQGGSVAGPGRQVFLVKAVSFAVNT